MKNGIPFIALIFIVSCNFGSEQEKPFNKEQIESEANQMLHEYHEAIQKGGLIAEFDYLDNSEDFFWVPPGYSTALDYDSVKTILESNALTFSDIKFNWKEIKVFPISSEVASFTGIVNGIMIDTSGTTRDVNIIESGTLIKRADGWKLLNGQSRTLE